MKRFDSLGFSLVLLLLVALRFGNLYFIWLTLMIGLLFYANRWWALYVYKNLIGTIHLHTHRLFPGESTDGEIIIENRGHLPIFMTRVKFSLWSDCPIKSDYFQIDESDRYLVKSNMTNYHGRFSIAQRQKIRIPFTVTSKKRGLYTFKKLTLQVVDPFGLEQFEKEIDLFEDLLIYPSEIDVYGLDQTHRVAQGETVVKRWILDDIFFPVGAQPYQTGDAFNRIDFKNTAKLQTLHTKKFDFTAHGDLCVIGNLLTGSYKWLFEEEHFERTLGIVSRLARESLQKDLRFSFYANAQAGKGLKVFEIPSSSGRVHYRRVLEVLSRFHVIHATSFSSTTTMVRRRFPNGALAVVITSYIDHPILQELDMLSKHGFEVYIVDSSLEVPSLQNWSKERWRKESV